MSWLPLQIANSLIINRKHEEEDEDEDDRPTTANDGNNHPQSQIQQQELNPNQDGSDSETLTTGVKGDLSEFTESLARQLWGVASLLAPPPPPPLPLPQSSSPSTTQPDISVSIRHHTDGDDVSNSICEGSRFGGETGVSNSSAFSNDNGEEKDDKAFVGVTDEVLSFAMNIAHHPETWLDFPLSEEEDNDDFEMSDTQWKHASLVEHLVPRLSALRIELCPVHMSESYFWKVYFVLLLSRLNKHDAHLLSTPQIVAARSMWMKELQIRTKPEPYIHQDFSATSSLSHNTNVGKQAASKRVPSYTLAIENYGEDEEDSWIHENNSELDGYNGVDVAHEDVSFSDLENDDCPVPLRCKLTR